LRKKNPRVAAALSQFYIRSSQFFRGCYDNARTA
jgi:hypothetical protein